MFVTSVIAEDTVLLSWTLLPAIGLALANLYCHKLILYSHIPRRGWLSFAGGVTVAYVFVHLLPELSERQRQFEEFGIQGLSFLEHHIYLMSLLGLVIFYGLEKLAVLSRQNNKNKTDSTTFWLHIISFGINNALIGYLLIQRGNLGVANSVVFTIAIAFHFVVNDDSLQKHHKSQYDRVGRWLLAGSVLFGWGVGSRTNVPELVIASLSAFVAGVIILNALKDELPKEGDSRFLFFCLGSFLYTVLLLVLEKL